MNNSIRHLKNLRRIIKKESLAANPKATSKQASFNARILKLKYINALLRSTKQDLYIKLTAQGRFSHEIRG